MVKSLFLGFTILAASILIFLAAKTRPLEQIAEKRSIANGQNARPIKQAPVAEVFANTMPGQGPVAGRKVSGPRPDLTNIVEQLKRDGANSRQLDMNPPPLPTVKPGTIVDSLDSVLPNGLPLWFRILDKDEDGQISLLEWRASGKTFEEFGTYDLNGDGFITAAEVLRHMKPANELKLEKGQADYNGAIQETDEMYNGNKLSKIFNIKLEKGKTYQFDHMSKAFDAYLYLEDPEGKLLAEDDDGGEGTNARIVHYAATTGTYRLIATSLGGTRPGAFSVVVRIVNEPGVLPKGLPSWFKDLDKDGHGQIALHEWRASGKTFAEFRKYDLNGDGLITAAEVLSYMNKLVDLTLAKNQVNYNGTIEEAAEERYQGKKSFKIITIKLEKGKTYQIDHTSQAFFAYLYLEDSDGRVLDQNNSGGKGLTARIVYRTAKAGTYRIIATSQDGYKTGPFSLKVRVVDSFAGVSPNGLPSWFKDLDKDGVGQISLHEWRASGGTFEEFRKYDLNGDGIITAAEVLRDLKMPIELKLVKGQAKFNGTIEATDEKYQNKKLSKIFTIKFEQGKTYQIDLMSQEFSGYLYLEDVDGQFLDKSYSGGRGLTSRIVYRAAEAGTFRIIATSQDGAKTGGFSFSVHVKGN